MRLNADQKQQRRKILQELYDQGYRYIAANRDNGDLLAGKSVRGRLEQFGVWGLEDPKSFRLARLNRDLFPDIQWEDKYPYYIEDGLI